MIVALGLTLVMFAAQPPQQDVCTLEVEAIRGQLDHTTHGVTTVAEPTRVDRQLAEAIRLSDGTLVRFVTGGCVHYGFSFTYTGVELDDQRFASAAARAKTLLGRTPVRDDAESNLQLLIGALDSPHDTLGAVGETYLGCGDAICRLLVVPDGSDGSVRLTVSYDFPL